MGTMCVGRLQTRLQTVTQERGVQTMLSHTNSFRGGHAKLMNPMLALVPTNKEHGFPS